MANNFPNLRPAFSADFVNGIYVDPRITFSRAGTRTYFGQEVVKAEENLFTNSATFPVSGGVLGGAVNNGDGTVTLSANTQSATRTSGQTFGVGVVFTISVELSGTGDVRLRGLAGSGVVLDPITTHTLSGTPTRYTLTNTNTASGINCGFQVLGAADDSPATVTISKFQFELRSFATAYTATTTQPITNYQRQLKTAAANEWPREFDPVTGECLGRSVWESRTNLLLRSEEFDNAYWTKVGATVSANQVIAPDGTLSMDKLVEDTANSGHSVQGTGVSVTSGIVYTFTIYAKAAERSFIRINGNSTGLVGAAYYNLSTGALGTVAAGTTASIVNVGNGIYRCVFTRTSTATTTVQFLVSVTNADNTSSYEGDGYSGIYIWGAQFEAGAFASPYTPTVAAQVTRLADSAVMTGVNFSSWYRQDEGAFFAEASHIGTTSFPTVVTASLGAASAAEQIVLYTTTTGITGESFFVRAGNVVQANINGGAVVASGVYFKTSGSYKVNDFATSLNGAAVVTDTSGILPVNDRLTIGALNTSTLYLNGYIKRLTYYNQALTAAQLQTVTR